MNRKDRLDRLEASMAALPRDRRDVQAALLQFRTTGRLPENDQLARMVVTEAIEKGDPGFLEPPRLWRDDPLLCSLLEEAVSSWAPLRSLARGVLAGVVAQGLDPAEPVFPGLGVEPTCPCDLAVLGLVGYPGGAPPDCRERAPVLHDALLRLAAGLGDGRRWLADVVDAVVDTPPDDFRYDSAVTAVALLDELTRRDAGSLCRSDAGVRAAARAELAELVAALGPYL